MLSSLNLSLDFVFINAVLWAKIGKGHYKKDVFNVDGDLEPERILRCLFLAST